MALGYLSLDPDRAADFAYAIDELRTLRVFKREDGLLRMVPGLGTRAVDRMSDDYPILVAPGQPTLRVNVSTDEKGAKAHNVIKV